MLNLWRAPGPATVWSLPAAPVPPGQDARAQSLSPRVAAALHAQAARAAARHFALYPQALGVALGAGSQRLAPGRRWVADVDTRGRRWWHDLGPARRRAEGPMLFADLGLAVADAHRPRTRLNEVADAAPAGSLLLMAVNHSATLRLLRDPAALRQCHPRLRLDALRRPLAAAGAAWSAWGLLREVLHGQPALALCEIGIDP